MESPPSSCTWSEAFILSEDSGLLLTNSSISSGSMSADEHSGSKLPVEFQDSDCEDKSLSQDGSLDGMSDIMCGENFNTLKKGAHWTYSLKQVSPIAPPPEFQDKPIHHVIDWYSNNLSKQLLLRALKEYKESSLRRIKLLNQLQRPMHLLSRHYWPPDFIPFSPCHIGRPNSRSSLHSSRLSSSHNSLSLPSAHKVDDSSFITQAVSHDTLTSNQISDLYNVPFDSDVYAVPVDVVKPPIKPKRNLIHKKRRRYTSSGFRDLDVRQCCVLSPYLKKGSTLQYDQGQYMLHNDVKRHSVAGTSAPVEGEPIHMTLEEVRRYLQTLYSSSSESSEHKDRTPKQKPAIIFTNNNKYTTNSPNNIPPGKDMHCVNFRTKKNMFLINIKNKKVKDSCDNVGKQIVLSPSNKSDKQKKQSAKIFSFKQALCNIFRFRKFMSTDTLKHAEHDKGRQSCYSNGNLLDDNHINRSSRALPPLPSKTLDRREEHSLDFATSIQRVKDYGWYWGPLSSESAEKILSNEPDGSFIVRDSSDDHYIFSLTFKLNDYVRHVRIEHDQGNFSFGTCTKFKSQTIVEFIENAVEHSRSGRYLFFLHRRPVIGPVRVQLLHPVSRFKQVQRLQHMCRFVIHKVVRRDLIPSLPLPRRMIDYLNTPHYYSEHVIDIEDNSDSQNYTSAGNQSEQENIVQNIEISNVPGNDYVMLDNPTPQSTRQS